MSATSSRSSRREFLSAAAIVPAAIVPTGLANRISTPAVGAAAAAVAPVVDAGAAQVDFMFLQLWRSEQYGVSLHETIIDPDKPDHFVASIHGTHEEAVGSYSHHDVVREKFKPHHSARRYRIDVQDWAPRLTLVDDESSEDYRARRDAAEAAYPQPRHVLDLPAPVYVGGRDPFVYDEGDLMDRETALAKCAEANAGFFPLESDERILEDWRIVLELGEPIGVGHFNVDLSDNGVGYEERTQCLPLRVVRPTAAEIAQFSGKAGVA